MNSGIIPQGPSEVIGDGAVVEKDILTCTALTDVAFTGLFFKFPATPANPATKSASTLPAGASLHNVAGITVTTGDLYVIYRGK